jgi:hypothetical protein
MNTYYKYIFTTASKTYYKSIYFKHPKSNILFYNIHLQNPYLTPKFKIENNKSFSNIYENVNSRRISK